MHRALPILLLACSRSGPGPTVDGPCESTQTLTPLPAEWSSGQVFEASAPLRLRICAGAKLIGRGVPSDPAIPETVDRSIVQLEVPVIHREPGEHEAETAVGHFDPAVFQQTPAPGRWRAILVRAWGERVPLQTGHPTAGVINGGSTSVMRSRIGVWAPEGIDVGPDDAVELTYEGRVPLRATTWAPLELHARVLDSACDCWTEVPSEPVEIAPDVPAFAAALAPMDGVAGEPVDVAVVLTDRYGNPSPWTGTATVAGLELAFEDSWRADGTVVLEAGDHRLEPLGTGAKPVVQWTRIHAGAPTHRRLVGDLHVHSGSGANNHAFGPSFLPGDHGGNYTVGTYALAYLSEVAGADFGALSEHSATDPEQASNPLGDAACAGDVDAFEGQAGWWEHSLAVAESAGTQRFTVFPAFEWFPSSATFFHRNVVYRDFGDTPLLSSFQPGVQPECIVGFLDAEGIDPSDAIVVPHLMYARATNLDWTRTYDGNLPAVATVGDIEARQAVGEIFSARNYNNALPGLEALTLFEGDSDTPAPYTYRYAWRDLGVRVGVIGASDNHHRMPGVDDRTPTDGTPFHRNGAGGHAVVLADQASRDGIFDGLVARRTYASSGPRVWMEATIDGSPPGTELSTGASSVEARIEILSGLPLDRVELWAAEVGGTAPWTAVYSATPGTETHTATLDLPNPAGLGQTTTWVYYARALTEPEQGNPDALWSSPIWVAWSG